MGHPMKFVIWLLLTISSLSSCSGGGSDVQCLKELKESLGDPNGAFSSWQFSDDGAGGYICLFIGVECWHVDESRVMILHLGNLGLEGSFPRGIRNCGSMTGLDLSSNSLSGPLPADISTQLPFITYLNLSYNSFSGEIPRGIVNLTYLNTLRLEHNQLSGRIPEQIGNLSRLFSLSVAGNSLSGPIPGSLQRFPAQGFAGNDRLCGAPLDRKCKKKKKRLHVRIHLRLRRINDASSIGAAVGFVLGFVVAFYFPHRFLCCPSLSDQRYIFRVCV